MQRLSLLQQLSDPITERWFDELGVDGGWHCAELGAGGGSIAEWLSDRVGPTGSVTAVDRDVSQLADLAATRVNMQVLQDDLCQVRLPELAFDLVHTRSVLMHLPCPDKVVEMAASALRPGGLVFFEEADGAPARSVVDPPLPYATVMVPIASRWSWAATLPSLLDSLGLVDIVHDVREEFLTGASPRAEFWKFTLGSVVELRGEAGVEDNGLEDAVVAMSALLDDPTFSVPFTTRHRVVARRPR